MEGEGIDQPSWLERLEREIENAMGMEKGIDRSYCLETLYTMMEALRDLRARIAAAQISMKPAIAKKALDEVSTMLHQNLRKDNFPSWGKEPQGFHPPGPPVPNFVSPGNLTFSEWNPNARGMPLMPWIAGRYGSEPSGFGPREFNDTPIARGGEAQSEFSMKILCSSKRIRGVIDGGGSVVKRLEQETGTRIDVANSSAGSDDCVIRVSALEAPWDSKSRTIDAILMLQDKTSEESEKGVITTRLLLPSSKVGCILGRGGQVINEMRRRTKADIRVNSKQDKPKCAGHNEELVEVSGNYSVAKDALAEISSRFRDRCLHDAIPGTEPSSSVPGLGYGPPGRIPVERPHPSGTIGVDRSGGYEPFKARKRARSSRDVDSAEENHCSQDAKRSDPLPHQLSSWLAST